MAQATSSDLDSDPLTTLAKLVQEKKKQLTQETGRKQPAQETGGRQLEQAAGGKRMEEGAREWNYKEEESRGRYQEQRKQSRKEDDWQQQRGEQVEQLNGAGLSNDERSEQLIPDGRRKQVAVPTEGQKQTVHGSSQDVDKESPIVQGEQSEQRIKFATWRQTRREEEKGHLTGVKDESYKKSPSQSSNVKAEQQSLMPEQQRQQGLTGERISQPVGQPKQKETGERQANAAPAGVRKDNKPNMSNRDRRTKLQLAVAVENSKDNMDSNNRKTGHLATSLSFVNMDNSIRKTGQQQELAKGLNFDNMDSSNRKTGHQQELDKSISFDNSDTSNRRTGHQQELAKSHMTHSFDNVDSSNRKTGHQQELDKSISFDKKDTSNRRTGHELAIVERPASDSMDSSDWVTRHQLTAKPNQDRMAGVTAEGGDADVSFLKSVDWPVVEEEFGVEEKRRQGRIQQATVEVTPYVLNVNRPITRGGRKSTRTLAKSGGNYFIKHYFGKNGIF